MTQKEAVLHYLNQHGSITSYDAIENLKVTRLAAVIAQLKKDGIIIDSIRQDVDTENYGRTTISRYFIRS